MENTAAGAITVLNHPISGYSDGLLLAMTAVLGFVVGLLAVGSVSLRRARRVRRRQLRAAERELSGQPVELERENKRLREDLAGQDLAARRLTGAAAAADLGSPAETARWAPVRRPAARGSPSMTRPGGSLASVATPTCRFCRPMTRPGPSRAR